MHTSFTIDETIKYINGLDSVSLKTHEPYLRKFLPVWEGIKDGCDFKYCTRQSGRYCNNCPHHPLRSKTPDSVVIYNKCLEFLENKNFTDFVYYLYSCGLPFPIVEEMEALKFKEV